MKKWYVADSANIFSNSLPKYAYEVAERVREAVGCQVHEVELKKFIEEMKGMVQKTNEAKKTVMEVHTWEHIDKYYKKSSFSIVIYKNKEKEQLIASLHLVEITKIMIVHDGTIKIKQLEKYEEGEKS